MTRAKRTKLLKAIRSFWTRFDDPDLERTVRFDACDRLKVSKDLARHIAKLGVIGLVMVGTVGCSIAKFNQPPTFGSAVTTHTRFFGLKVTVPISATDTMGVLLGWGSTTLSIIPVSTNQIYTATVSDIFTLSSAINPFDTAIKEILQTGYAPNNVPTPPLRMFEPEWVPVPPASKDIRQ